MSALNELEEGSTRGELGTVWSVHGLKIVIVHGSMVSPAFSVFVSPYYTWSVSFWLQAFIISTGSKPVFHLAYHLGKMIRVRASSN